MKRILKRLFIFLTVLLIAVLTVVIYRTATHKSKQILFAAGVDAEVNVEKIVERLSQAIRFRTISHQDPLKFEMEAFLNLRSYLEEAFPMIHAMMTREVVNDYGLLYTWKGSGELKPIILLAHMDVVPVDSDAESKWTHPPFEGRVIDGYVWGRGAMDDKSSLMGIMEAVEMLLEIGFKPKRTIYLAFGHDEEIGGKKGAAEIARLLQSRGVSAEFVLDEGSIIADGFIQGLSAPVALIGTGEKGYASIELTVEAAGGHSSMPPKQTAVGILSSAVYKLEENKFPARLEGSAKQMLEYLGPEMKLPLRAVCSNLWLFEGVVVRQFSQNPATDAAIRTTTAVTMIEGGVKENVLAPNAKAVVNFRILQGDSIELVLKHVEKTIDDSRVKIRLIEETAVQPSKISSADTQSFKLLQEAIAEVYSDVLTAPTLVLGGTDSKHFSNLSANIYRFLPIVAKPQDLLKPHGNNENISVTDYHKMVKFYFHLIKRGAS